MIPQLERAKTLAHAVLLGPENDRPDALFDLVKMFAEMPASDREDCAEAAHEAIYPLTKHYRESFEVRRSA